MEYNIRLLKDHTGVIVNRKSYVGDSVRARFVGSVPTCGKYAIFSDDDENTTYIKIDQSGTVVVPDIIGRIHLVVADLGGTRQERWVCEDITTELTEEGSVLFSPGDEDLKETVASLKIENEEMRDTISDLRDELDELTERIEQMQEGYDTV